MPAIDIMGGECVRLLQGDFKRRTGYGEVLEVAERFEKEGAGWVHVVDLDRARNRESSSESQIIELIHSTKLRVQVGGGIRSLADVESYLESGAARVVLATAAVGDFSFLESAVRAFPGLITLALDYRRVDGKRMVAVNGWQSSSQIELMQAVDQGLQAGCTTLLATDISKDGMKSGPDLETYEELLATFRFEVISSGGVGSLSDLRALKDLRVSGNEVFAAVVGKAIHDGNISVRQAVDLCNP